MGFTAGRRPAAATQSVLAEPPDYRQSAHRERVMIDKIVAEQTSVTASALSLLTPLALIQLDIRVFCMAPALDCHI